MVTLLTILLALPLSQSDLAPSSAFLVVADDPKPKDDSPAKPSKTDADLKLMQGKWVGTSPEGMETKWEIKDRELTVEIGELVFGAKITLDAEAQPYASVDFKLTKPADVEDKTVLGIYKIEKDKLTVCVAMPDDPDRPTVFQASEEKVFLYELKRAKK